MAKFKVGDKARVVQVHNRALKHWLNREVEIVELIEEKGYQYVVVYHGMDVLAADCHLAPLTPPAVDEKAREKVSKLIRTLTHPESPCLTSTIKSTRTV